MFSDYFFPELGGIQDSIALLGAALGRRGHQVEIHVPRYGRRDYARVAATGERDLGPNVRVVRRRSVPFPSSTRQSRAVMPSPLGWAGLRRRRPDVIHVHSFFGIGLEALLDATMLRIPVIGTNHTTVAGFAGHMPVSVDHAAAYVLWFYNRCDFVTAPSRSVFAELGLGRLHRRHCVISNPIDTRVFTPGTAADRHAARQHLNLTHPTIAFAGRLGPEKNLDLLLRALALLDDAELVLAGHGSDEARLRALAQALGIADRIRFLGTLPATGLAALLRASDVFAMPSTSETQSMAMLQAMACGLPVIAADSRALPEFVGPNSGLLVDPHDPAALARALAALLSTPGQRQDLGTAGRRAAENYSIETISAEWEAIYYSMRNNNGHGSACV